MRWEDERYVRVYTRDTPEWSALSWEARSVFWGLLRRCDRAGILQVGKAGLRALAGVIPAPLDVVERAVPELLADGCLRAAEGAYIVPNYLTAQDACTSDAQRKRDQRERDRARLMASGIVGSPAVLDKVAVLERQSVTPRDEESRPGVTPGHEPSQPVTPSHSVPSRAVPDQNSPSENPRAAPAGPAPLRLEEQRPKRTRKPSQQEVLYTALVAHRREVLGPETLEDERWSVQRQNEALGGQILEAEPGIVLAALQRFLESDFAGRCNPPGPLAVFVKQWSRWVSEVMRSNAGGVK